MKLPEKFTLRMKEMLGGEYEDFLDAYLNAPVYSGIRINTLKDGAKDAVLGETGALDGVPWCGEGFYADKRIISGNHPFHCAGLFYFQEPSAMCAVSGLPVNNGDKVLDLCAAPGGKTTQAAAKLNGSGLIVANEIVRKRAEILSENVERMGIRNAVVTNETPQRLAEKYPNFFDKIIVDAPCSGEGMFRKEPQALDEWSIEHTVSCGVRQKHILDCAVKMLAPNGMIVYSTCTFAPEENEKIAAYMIEEHGMETVPMPELSMLERGRAEWSGADINAENTYRIFPHKQKGEGHFAVLFKKNGGEEHGALREKPQKTDERIKYWKEFEKKFLNTNLDGDFVFFGDNLYLKPVGINIDKIKVLRCGLHLGEVKKNRFEPSHALALALCGKDFKNIESFGCESSEIKAYLSGDVVKSDKNGWCAVCADGYPVGWGKASGGIMKNHYPKRLRIKTLQK